MGASGGRSYLCKLKKKKGFIKHWVDGKFPVLSTCHIEPTAKTPTPTPRGGHDTWPLCPPSPLLSPSEGTGSQISPYHPRGALRHILSSQYAWTCVLLKSMGGLLPCISPPAAFWTKTITETHLFCWMELWVIRFHSCIIFHFRNLIQFLCPFHCWWMSGRFFTICHCERLFCEHSWVYVLKPHPPSICWVTGYVPTQHDIIPSLCSTTVEPIYVPRSNCKNVYCFTSLPKLLFLLFLVFTNTIGVKACTIFFFFWILVALPHY